MSKGAAESDQVAGLHFSQMVIDLILSCSRFELLLKFNRDKREC